MRTLNRHMIETLKKDLAIEGRIQNPVIINPEMDLIDGTHRLHAAKDLGWTYIPAIMDRIWTVDTIRQEEEWHYAMQAVENDYDMKGSIVDQIDELIAAVLGNNDGPSWLCLYNHKDKYYKFQASCCYTGFDASGGGTLETHDDFYELLSDKTLEKREQCRLFYQLMPLLKLDESLLIPEFIGMARGMVEAKDYESPILADWLKDRMDHKIINFLEQRCTWAIYALVEYADTRNER